MYRLWIRLCLPLTSNLKAVDYFLALPNQRELAKHILSHSEWQVLEDFERILQASLSTRDHENHG
jgi:hypothetical protein